MAAIPADAAHDAVRTAAKQTKERGTALAAQDPETTSSIRSDADDETYCQRSRKRLFVEGEGWIVRQVTICY